MEVSQLSKGDDGNISKGGAFLVDLCRCQSIGIRSTRPTSGLGAKESRFAIDSKFAFVSVEHTLKLFWLSSGRQIRKSQFQRKAFGDRRKDIGRLHRRRRRWGWHTVLDRIQTQLQ